MYDPEFEKIWDSCIDEPREPFRLHKPEDAEEIARLRGGHLSISRREAQEAYEALKDFASRLVGEMAAKAFATAMLMVSDTIMWTKEEDYETWLRYQKVQKEDRETRPECQRKEV